MLNKKYIEIKECRLCGCQDLISLIDFGLVALGNNLQDNKENSLKASKYPLEVVRCISCNHFQLSCAVDPNLLYATNYTYLSGVGKSFVTHINKYVDWIETKTNISKSALILDVGSNDGTCLEVFKKKGYAVCGIDPAKLAVKISREKGIFTINNFFNNKTANDIINMFGKIDLITSQNVLAHVDNLKETFANIHYLLKDDGFFVFEVGYFKNVIETVCFDTIYHEHIDYHHASPLIKHLSSLGFETLSIEQNEIQGGSIRILLKKSSRKYISNQAKEFLSKEVKSVIYQNKNLSNWSNEINNICKNIRDIVKKEKNRGMNCLAYGSPTKATLLLKMTKLNSSDIKFIIEDNDHKVGKFLPNNGISIHSINRLNFNEPVVIIILAWNFYQDIIKKLKMLYKVPIKVIIPLPKVKVIDL